MCSIVALIPAILRGVLSGGNLYQIGTSSVSIESPVVCRSGPAGLIRQEIQDRTGIPEPGYHAVLTVRDIV